MVKSKGLASNLKVGATYIIAFIAVGVMALLTLPNHKASAVTPDKSWSCTADSPQHYTECLLKFVEENNQMETLYKQSGLYRTVSSESEASYDLGDLACAAPGEEIWVAYPVMQRREPGFYTVVQQIIWSKVTYKLISSSRPYISSGMYFDPATKSLSPIAGMNHDKVAEMLAKSLGNTVRNHGNHNRKTGSIRVIQKDLNGFFMSKTVRMDGTVTDYEEIAAVPTNYTKIACNS